PGSGGGGGGGRGRGGAGGAGRGAARWSHGRRRRLCVPRAGPGRPLLRPVAGPPLTRPGSQRRARAPPPAPPRLRLRRPPGRRRAPGRPDARARPQDERLLAGRAVLALLLPALPEPHRRQAGLPAARAHLHGAGARAARPRARPGPGPRRRRRRRRRPRPPAAAQPAPQQPEEGAGPGACSLHLSERADWQYSQRELDAVEVFFSRTARDNRLGCMFVRCAPSSRYTLLFSHGNAVDLGQMCSFYIGLGSRINCNIFSYDYSGYGVSSGKPSEKNLYADIDAAWQALRTRYGVSPENIILYGQSIGTVPTVDLASRYECAAVILHSPLMSGLRVAFPDTRKTYCFDAFPSIDKISKVTSPVLVIHGTEDEVIDFSHGLAMYERCPRAVEPLWVEGAGHNDIELYAQYLERLKQFISHELPNS
uniref:Alpha/beta hydrolase domain-containing protein 17C n=2 Tax=Caniformia TaxID=379584 RepID=A0A8C0N2N9_CANLF